MKILLITNLYPPQELGGYGRAMADFVWGLRKLGHEITVICSNAPYLNTTHENQEYEINRSLSLKGSYEGGVNNILDPIKRSKIDQDNIALLKEILLDQNWTGILIGNLDLIGLEILPTLINTGLPILHHIGFMEPSFSSLGIPKIKRYVLLSASYAVYESLVQKGFKVEHSNIIYPGARVELFDNNLNKRKLPELPDGSQNKPLCIGFAGLLMSSKGLHTLIEALVKLKDLGIFTRTYIAGGEFGHGYKEALENFLNQNHIRDSVFFTGSLTRSQLSRFFRLNHIFVFPSIYPEAFGIVQAEAMASGLALISSGVGGSKELVEPGINGWLFKKEDPNDLSQKLLKLAKNPQLIHTFGQNGKRIAYENFSTLSSAKKIEEIFLNFK